MLNATYQMLTGTPKRFKEKPGVFNGCFVEILQFVAAIVKSLEIALEEAETDVATARLTTSSSRGGRGIGRPGRDRDN